jgi:hypothetical protein
MSGRDSATMSRTMEVSCRYSSDRTLGETSLKRLRSNGAIDDGAQWRRETFTPGLRASSLRQAARYPEGSVQQYVMFMAGV